MNNNLEAVGIDVGGTGIKLGIVNRQGVVRAREEIPTMVDLEWQAGVSAIARAAADLWQREYGAGARPTTVGVGCAGLIDRAAGVVRTSPNLPGWHEVPLGPTLAAELEATVQVLNDADAFALAEARAGAGQGLSPVVALTLGTGVGGALVAEGVLQGGLHGYAGEIGHMSVDLEGPVCACGNRGCLELYVGKRGILAAYFGRADWQEGSPAYEYSGGDCDVLTPKMVAVAAAAGESAARAAFDSCGEVLGVALANLCNLIDPAVFVVGGGVSQAADLILEPARRALAPRAMIPADPIKPLPRAGSTPAWQLPSVPNHCRR